LSQLLRSKAFRRWIVPILTIVIVIGVVNYIMSKRFWVHQNIHEPLQRRAAELTAELKAIGLNVGDPQLADGIPGTEQIVVLEIGGRPIRLLEFDMSNEVEKREVQHIHDAHSTRVLGVDQPAEVEGAVAIIDFETHPEKNAILGAFHKHSSSGKP